jgi:hypothetical protein
VAPWVGRGGRKACGARLPLPGVIHPLDRPCSTIAVTRPFGDNTNIFTERTGRPLAFVSPGLVQQASGQDGGVAVLGWGEGN